VIGVAAKQYFEVELPSAPPGVANPYYAPQCYTHAGREISQAAINAAMKAAGPDCGSTVTVAHLQPGNPIPVGTYFRAMKDGATIGGAGGWADGGGTAGCPNTTPGLLGDLFDSAQLYFRGNWPYYEYCSGWNTVLQDELPVTVPVPYDPEAHGAVPAERQLTPEYPTEQTATQRAGAALLDPKNDPFVEEDDCLILSVACERPVPSCLGLTYETCAHALQEAGFYTHHKVVVQPDVADFDEPAGAVLRTDPARDENVSIASDIAVEVNPDPMPEWRPGAQQKRHDCDRSDPSLTLFTGHEEYEPFDGDWAQGIIDTDPAPTFSAPQEGGTATLRWGWTAPPGDDQDHDEWGGWGWLHIQAKHGWSQADATDTAAVLQSGVRTIEEDGRHVYRGLEYAGKNGAWCIREVVIEPQPQLGDTYQGAPAPAPGILTSFGKRIN